MNKAEFLWPHDDGSVEALGYEFANALTEEYRKQVWDALTAEMRKRTLLRAAEMISHRQSELDEDDAFCWMELSQMKQAILKEAE